MVLIHYCSLLRFRCSGVTVQVATTVILWRVRVTAAGLTCGKGFLQLRCMFQMCEEVDRCRTLARPGSMPTDANVSSKAMVTLSVRVESLSVPICALQSYTTAA